MATCCEAARVKSTKRCFDPVSRHFPLSSSVQYACSRALRGAANFHGAIDVAIFQVVVNPGKQFLGVDGRKVEGDNPFDAKAQAKNHTEKNGKHELPTTLNELLLEHLDTCCWLNIGCRGSFFSGGCCD